MSFSQETSHVLQSYFDQAADVARLLNIKLTQKTWGGQRILMCGFPLMHLNKYLKVLVQEHNRFVAMCEEFARDPTLGAKGGFDRRVVRIVTPGTLIDEPFLVPYENNYLLSVVPAPPPEWAEVKHAVSPKLPIGLAWIDVSTGEFYTKSTVFSSLKDELVRISPKEVVLDQRHSKDTAQHVRNAIVEEGFFVSSFTSPEEPPTDDVISVTTSATQASPDDLTSIQLKDGLLPVPLSEEETKAVELLTAFMHTNLMEHMPALSSPTREVSSGRMQIDSQTVKSLEIREGLRDGGTTGSLLSVIKRTVTTSGTRLLARWLCKWTSPLYLYDPVIFTSPRLAKHFFGRNQRSTIPGRVLPRKTLPERRSRASPPRDRGRYAHRPKVHARSRRPVRPVCHLYHRGYLGSRQG